MTQEHRETLGFLLRALRAVVQGFKLSTSLLVTIEREVVERLKTDTDK